MENTNNNLWDWWWNAEDIVKSNQLPPGVAILGYIPIKQHSLSNYIVLTKLHSPVPFYKEQNIAEIDIPGRNTPVLQAMGGRGLKYIPIEFTLHGETAHDELMRLCGWVDAGDPMYFAFDVWIRKVLMKNLNFREEKYHTWYTCSSELWKYEPLATLKYPRDVSNLIPIPTIPATPKPPGAGGGGKDAGNTDEWEFIDLVKYKAKFKKKNGKVDCVPYTIKEGDTWPSIIASHYGWSGKYNGWIKMFVLKYNVKVGNIDAKYAGDFLLISELVGKTICLPREIIINPGKVDEVRVKIIE